MSAPPALSPWCNSLRTLAEVVGDVRLQAREGTILLGFTDHTVNVLIHSYLAPPAVNARTGASGRRCRPCVAGCES